MLILALNSFPMAVNADLKSTRIIRSEYGLKNIKISISDKDINQQMRLPNHISYEKALRLAIESFLNDDSDVESPLSLVMDNEPSQPSKEKAKQILLQYLNKSTSRIQLLPLHEKPEGGESCNENWIFYLYISDLSDHAHWAVIDRKGLEAPYNYGFN